MTELLSSMCNVLTALCDMLEGFVIVLKLAVASAILLVALFLHVMYKRRISSKERVKFPRREEVTRENKQMSCTNDHEKVAQESHGRLLAPVTEYTITTFPRLSQTTTIVCISDTHGHHRELTMPKGDILIHAGDFTLFGRDASYMSKDIDTQKVNESASPLHDFNAWLGELDYKYKIIVNGNHECNARWKHRAKELLSNGILLVDEWLDINLNELHRNSRESKLTTLCTDNIMRIYGMQFYWSTLDGKNPYHDKVTDSMDILITHTPVDGYVDRDRGCPALRKLVHRLRPKIVISGHEHMATGITENNDNDDYEGDDPRTKIVYVNAANAKGGIRNGHALGKEPIVLKLISSKKSL